MKRSLTFLLLLFLLPNILVAEDEKPLRKLVIYSTRIFASIWIKAAPHFKQAFESECNCSVELTVFGSSSAAISRLMLEGKNSPADLAIGLDTNMADKTEDLNLFAPHNVSVDNLAIPTEWNSKYFIPYDYGYLAFIYNTKKLKNPPSSFQELMDNPNLKIIIQDPRSSTLGLGLVAWVNLIYQDKAPQVWKKLKNNIVTVTKNWSDSYNLFTQGEADLLLSYSTSPAYNMIVEDNSDIKAAQFKEGHFLQIELIGKLKTSKEPDLADKFMQFALTHAFQHSIPINNFMYPVINIGKDLPKEYAELFTPSKVFMTIPGQMRKNRNLWVQEWLQALSRK